MNNLYITGIVQNTVSSIFRNLVGVEEIYIDSTIAEDMGCDMLDIVEVIMAIEYQLNIAISDELYMQGDEKAATIKANLTISDIINYCIGKVVESLETDKVTNVDSLPKKPVSEASYERKIDSEINISDVLRLFDDCSESRLINPDETTLAEKSIIPGDVVELIMQNSTITIDGNEIEIDNYEDGYEISAEGVNVFNWSEEIEPVNTINELAAALADGWEESIEFSNDNIYDWIVESCQIQDWYCLYNSLQIARLDTQKFISVATQQLGIYINAPTISKFQGTIGEFIEELVKRANKTSK